MFLPCLLRNGDEWYRLRRAVQQMMLRPREVSYYYPLQDGVARKLVDRITKEVDDNGSIHNLHHLVAKWILECKEGTVLLCKI